MKWQLVLIIGLLALPIASAIQECEGVMNKGDLPCHIISIWQFPCEPENITIYNQVPKFLRQADLVDFGISGRCNVTFGIETNETLIGSYLLNWSTGDSSKIIIEEDSNMLIALVIGVSLIVCLFVFLTFATKDDKPFLAHFFFLGIFIFTTVLSNLIWKITNVNAAPYEPIMLVIYRMMLIITMLMMFIILVIVTIEAVQLRKWEGNPIDTYRDNLKENE